MINKKAYSAKMIFDVPDSEKRIAEKAVESFEDLLGLLRFTINHLNLIYDPFKNLSNPDPKVLEKNEEILTRYIKAIEHNFNLIFEKTNQCVVLMGTFASDTKTKMLMNSFLAYIHDLEKQVDILIKIFENYKNSDFISNLIASIDILKKKNSQIKQLISDRILDHVETNILAKNWVSNIVDDDNNSVYNKEPILKQLYKERMKALESKE